MGMSELSLEMGEWPPESPRPGSGEGVGGLSERDKGCMGGGVGYEYLYPPRRSPSHLFSPTLLAPSLVHTSSFECSSGSRMRFGD